MNFEETYKKYKAGTATEEERTYVEKEIDKARKISAILDDDSDRKILDVVDRELVKKAKKAFQSKTTIRIIIIVVCSLIVLGGIICSIIFGGATYFASRSATLTEQEVIEIAKECINDYTDVEKSNYVVNDAERELSIDNKLTESIYIYDIEIDDKGIKYKVEVNAVSGYATIVDIHKENAHIKKDMKRD